MQGLLAWLRRRRFPYEPLITVSISKENLLHNIAQFRKLIPSGVVAPVLKSNAYGHDLVKTAAILELSNHIPFFVVDSYFEAVALRARRFKTSILVIGYTRPEIIVDSRLKHVAFTVTDMATLRRFAAHTPEAPEEAAEPNSDLLRPPRIHRIHIHLKIDTGMHRQGIQPSEVAEALEIMQGNRLIGLEGVCTHFCDASNEDPSFTEAQMNVWHHVLAQIREIFPDIKYTHVAATDGSHFSKEIDANVMRLGIGMYGITDNSAVAKSLDLKPALEMTTIISGVKHIKAGESVGYSGTFKAMNDMTVATIPVGYFEALDRRLSSGHNGEPHGYIQVGPERVACPIIGRVSMNITTIDVSNVRGVAIGMNVIVISRDPHAPNSLVNMAKACDTIPYELAVHIPAQLKRVIV